MSWNGREGGLYSSSGENMNEMSFNEGWQGLKSIMNLDPILDFGESWCIKCRDWWEWWVNKIQFSRSYYNSLQSQITKKKKKIISYSILTEIISFLCSNWSPGYLVSGKINLIRRFKILWEILMKWWVEVIC